MTSQPNSPGRSNRFCINYYGRKKCALERNSSNARLIARKPRCALTKSSTGKLKLRQTARASPSPSSSKKHSSCASGRGAMQGNWSGIPSNLFRRRIPLFAAAIEIADLKLRSPNPVRLFGSPTSNGESPEVRSLQTGGRCTGSRRSARHFRQAVDEPSDHLRPRPGHGS